MISYKYPVFMYICLKFYNAETKECTKIFFVVLNFLSQNRSRIYLLIYFNYCYSTRSRDITISVHKFMSKYGNFYNRIQFIWYPRIHPIEFVKHINLKYDKSWNIHFFVSLTCVFIWKWILKYPYMKYKYEQKYYFNSTMYKTSLNIKKSKNYELWINKGYISNKIRNWIARA